MASPTRLAQGVEQLLRRVRKLFGVDPDDSLFDRLDTPHEVDIAETLTAVRRFLTVKLGVEDCVDWAAQEGFGFTTFAQLRSLKDVVIQIEDHFATDELLGWKELGALDPNHPARIAVLAPARGSAEVGPLSGPELAILRSRCVLVGSYGRIDGRRRYAVTVARVSRADLDRYVRETAQWARDHVRDGRELTLGEFRRFVRRLDRVPEKSPEELQVQRVVRTMHRLEAVAIRRCTAVSVGDFATVRDEQTVRVGRVTVRLGRLVRDDRVVRALFEMVACGRGGGGVHRAVTRSVRHRIGNTGAPGTVAGGGAVSVGSNRIEVAEEVAEFGTASAHRPGRSHLARVANRADDLGIQVGRRVVSRAGAVDRAAGERLAAAARDEARRAARRAGLRGTFTTIVQRAAYEAALRSARVR